MGWRQLSCLTGSSGRGADPSVRDAGRFWRSLRREAISRWSCRLRSQSSPFSFVNSLFRRLRVRISL